jgi:hypothetical protein
LYSFQFIYIIYFSFLIAKPSFSLFDDDDDDDDDDDKSGTQDMKLHDENESTLVRHY